jgi:multiple sugar transport system ATP-binding protein
MSKVLLKHIYKVYEGGVRAVNDFDLEIKDKEFIVFVGPSGCGKSTTLRMIAGLENITAGQLYIDDVLVNDVDSKDRDIAMVFQNYALYPHMSVYQNMAFGLKLRKENPKDIDERVRKATEILEIGELLSRKPKALSGGQRQRVALGRAIVREPKVFLLDEPLSNLDAKLRVQMRIEITKLHKKLATTFIYVTHDQTEAMTMGDRIVVMKDGYIQQVDTPVNLYENPTNLFVATFLGSPQMNILDAKLVKQERGLSILLKGSDVAIPLSERKAKQLTDESLLARDLLFGIRPEHIHFAESGIAAVVDVVEQLGDETIAYVKVDGLQNSIIVKGLANGRLKAKQNVFLKLEMENIHLFDSKSTNSILGVPRENRFPCQIKGSELLFADGKFVFSNNYTERMFDECFVNQNITLNFVPEAVRLEKNNPGLEISGVVDFLEVNTDTVTVFMRLNKTKPYLVFQVSPDSSIKVGDELKTFVDEDDIILRDADNMRLVSREIILPNVCEADIETNPETKLATIRFGNNKVIMPLMGDYNGHRQIRLQQDKVRVIFNKKVSKELKITNPPYDKNRLIGVSSFDEEMLGKKNAIFVQVSGIDHYATFLVDANFSVYKMPKFNLYLEDGAISVIK